MDDEVRKAHLRRLQLLELRAAREGHSTPPQVIMEIESIEKDLKLYYTKKEYRASPYGGWGPPKVMFENLPQDGFSVGHIEYPFYNADVHGRTCDVMGKFDKFVRSSEHWIAVSPDQAYGLWWPQGGCLEVNSKGAWYACNVFLGRELPDGIYDIDRTFEIGLYQVNPRAKDIFSKSSDVGIHIPSDAYLIHKIIVIRRSQ